MSNETMAKISKSNADIWIAAGVVVCLGAGATLTYWLSSAPAEGPPTPPKPLVLKGDPIKGDVVTAPGKNSNPLPANVSAQKSDSDYMDVTFATLASYYYDIPNLDSLPKGAKPKEQIPQPIKNLSGKRVGVKGFMWPVKVQNGATTNFLLLKDQSLCCFGKIPQMNEWISVKMSHDKAAKYIGDQPVTVYGKLDVGEEIDQGEVLSVYRMTADDVAGPLDL